VQRELREIYQELVEIDTTDSAGNCTVAAEAMAARLKSGGVAAAEVRIIVPPDAPKKGNLVARLRGTGTRRPVLLLAHIDVVEARREDWQRDPFKLIEENGYFYARGAADNKAMAAVFVHNLVRYGREGYRPDRDLIVALTCDEEIIPSPHNGVEHLLKQHRPLIDAELALNEGGGGLLDQTGKPVRMNLQLGEKVFQTYLLEVTSRGGHSAVPTRDNAITHLAEGLARLGAFEFPFRLSPATRAFFERMANIESGQAAADMRAILREPPDAQAVARLARTPLYNATFRTTCTATMMEAGHATNALPQRARASVNCRILPGESVPEVRRTLVRVLANERIRVDPVGEPVLSPPPPLDPQVLGAVEALTNEMWPGVPVVPTQLVAATDGRFLNNAGIWTYGISGMFRDPDGGGVHGLNERLPVRSLYEGHAFLYRLVKRLAGGS
jgi:acetylornithine deacetylase/succinyl-diaminopimelate desuccinylase-like protein